MRIFIAGAGEVGTHLAKLFVTANHDITLMDEDEEKLKQIDAHFDLLTRVGVMTSLEDLKMINKPKARIITTKTNARDTLPNKKNGI